jgi:hypothetical protein
MKNMNQQNLRSHLIDQSLAMAYNYLNTGRPSKSIEMLGVVKKIDPDNLLVPDFFQLITAIGNGFCRTTELADEFGILWSGENLNGKTIEVFCDQGMGDTINMLRYIHLMKKTWSCKIVLNCYAYFDQFERLIESLDYIDEFVKFHKKCDFQTNVFSLPAILSSIELPIYYPAHFNMVMERGFIPLQEKLIEEFHISMIDKPKVGVAWQSNKDNVLSSIKTVPVDVIEQLKSDQYDLYSLDPVECPEFMNKTELRDLYDTAIVIDDLDYVVSVDTVVLHLAGAMGATTFGLIPDDCDPRWGKEDDSVWYPSVKLIRQQQDWSKAVNTVKEALESLTKIL